MPSREKMLKNPNYVPPDGGYGYFIVCSLIITGVLGVTSLETFGIIHGPYLSTLGNEGQSSSTICSVFSFMYFFSALPANILLQKLSARKVAFIASFFYVSGGFLTIFFSTVPHLIITNGIFQGFGWGISQPTIATCMGHYFESKRSFAINLSLAIISVLNAASPSLFYFIMERYGYRGTLLILSAINMHIILAALVLHPVEWHVKKRPRSAASKEAIEENVSLLKTTKRDDVQQGRVLQKTSAWGKFTKVCTTIYRFLDLELFKMPIYLSITIGTSLSITSDGLFTALLPWMLKSSQFLGDDVILLITIYYASDIVGKILICILVRFVQINSRTLQLVGAYAICAFRLMLVFSKSFWLIASVCALLGTTRCLIQNTTFLVIAETFPNRIMTAFTLLTVFNGFVTLVLGYIVGYIVSITGKSDILLFTLSVISALHAVIWTVEKVCVLYKKQPASAVAISK